MLRRTRVGGAGTSPPPPTPSPSPSFGSASLRSGCGRGGGGSRAKPGGGGSEVRRVRAVALLLLALGLSNLGKALVAARYAALLPDLPMTVPWGYLIAVGAFWGVVLATCGAILWRATFRIDLTLTPFPLPLSQMGEGEGVAPKGPGAGVRSQPIPHRPRPWARWATLAAATLYQAHVWLDHLLFDRSDYALQTRPRDLLLSGLFLAFVWGTLNWPRIKKLPRRAQEAQRK